MQPALMQSLFLLQRLLVAHLGQVAPPQSVSVSSPFLFESVQWSTHTLALQTPLAQSLEIRQALPLAHLFEQAIPQSTSLSNPSFTPSAHCPTHLLATQWLALAWQSPSTLH